MALIKQLTGKNLSALFGKTVSTDLASKKPNKQQETENLPEHTFEVSAEYYDNSEEDNSPQIEEIIDDDNTENNENAENMENMENTENNDKQVNENEKTNDESDIIVA
jgi:hypothetical protein